MEWWKLTPAQRRKSFQCAVAGLAAVVRSQPNALLILAASVGTALAGWFFHLARWEWCFVLAAVALVWITEILNTALEWTLDLVSPQHHPLAGKAKDATAAAVLVAVGFSLVVAALIFGPRLRALF